MVVAARARAEAGKLAFGTVDCFLIWRLTGGKQHVTDASNASRTLLWNLGKYLFIKFAAGSMKYSAVYGALGVLAAVVLIVALAALVWNFVRGDDTTAEPTTTTKSGACQSWSSMPSCS